MLRAAAISAEGGAAAVVLFWGDPAPLVDEARTLGLKVLIQVGSLEETHAAAAAGVDAVIAEGVEAGGHVRGPTSVGSSCRRPSPPSRPFPSSRPEASATAPASHARSGGSQGVSLGTRFVASDEANVDPQYKWRVVASRRGGDDRTAPGPVGHIIDWPRYATGDAEAALAVPEQPMRV